jgi:hypothetical protein
LGYSGRGFGSCRPFSRQISQSQYISYPVTARFAPHGGKLARLDGLGYGGGMALLVVLAFLALLFVTREFGPEDRARFARVLSRKRPQ